MERGLSAFEQQEYADAREAFVDAARLDPRNPLPVAWHSRVSRLMRQDQDAADAGNRAAALTTDQLSDVDRAFVAAVVAESRGNAAIAEARYRELLADHPDEYAWIVEFAAFRDRGGFAREAVEAFHRALSLERGAVRPHMELCRLYSPSGLNEPALAKEQGRLALAGYKAAGDPGGEAQALWCLTDVLRAGTDAERREARTNAEDALRIVERLGYKYGLARAYNYLGIVALLAERNGREAASLFQEALVRARQTGNMFLEPRLLMNLGVSSELFRERRSAVNYYQESFRLFERMGIQQQAAWSQANAAAILVMYGADVEKGARDARNALGVFERLDDKFFEVHARRTLAWYYRYTGHPEEALRELTIAKGVASERNLEDRLVQVTIDLAALRFDANDYPGSGALLRDALKRASGADRVNALIDLARTNTRLGAFQDADTLLRQAADESLKLRESGSPASLYLAQGELAYESNRWSDARAQFERSAETWRDDLPAGDSVEARAYVGLVTALQGQLDRGRAIVQASLEQAQRMGRLALTARCRVFLARIEMAAKRPTEAMRTLAEIKPESEAALGPELSGQVHYWRSKALGDAGDSANAALEAGASHKLLDELLARVPEPNREALRARPDIRLIGGA
jgi:tetratricopeptide (TPR) repeat protein